MLKSALVSIVNTSTRYAWQLVVLTALLSAASVAYSVKHFSINTDIGKMISPDLPFRQREATFAKSFPQQDETILAVVEAGTGEQASQASEALVERLKGQTQRFRSVTALGGGEFFERNALLFPPVEDVERTTTLLTTAAPLIRTLATDPTLRGLSQALAFTMIGARTGKFQFDALATPLNLFSTSLENVVGARPASFSWYELLQGKAPEPSELRRFIDIHPVLDFSALEPGKAATDAIRQAAADLNLASNYGARVRLTGPVPIADEEFATVQENAFLNAAGTILIVLCILFLALRSARIILAVFLTLMVSLSITAAVGLMLVGSLNLISIAFAVLCVGLGVDFSIQYAVRYRAERYENDILRSALANAADHVGIPLTLAAAATTVGFLSFLPTDYRGVAELGAIAGAGMLIAFFTTLTVLPALLALLNPPGEKEPLGYASFAPLDGFLLRRRVPIVVVTCGLALAGLPLLYYLHFDFNPLNLRNPKVESVATFLALRSDPATGANSINILAPTPAEATAKAERLDKLPEVSRTITLNTFVPDGQEEKLGLIAKAEKSLGPGLSAERRTPPTDEENVAALNKGIDALKQALGDRQGAGADAVKRLAAVLTKIADADAAVRAKAEAVLISPLMTALRDVREMLKAQPVSAETLPLDLTRQWVSPDGLARVEVQPSGDPNDNDTIRAFARAVLAVEPTAIGGPISILESGRTIISAFMQAGVLALVAITILLWIALRRLGDVVLTILPLLLAGVVTLELCVILGTPINYANIIALPLMLGVGVAFKIYYTMAWRSGIRDLLQSSLTRAVIFSAFTTATAFGSLWLSSHPGTSSMGRLLALSLLTTLCAAVLFQPALMGRPRNSGDA